MAIQPMPTPGGREVALRAPGPAAARAAISPSALVLAGAGTALGVVVGLPVLAAVGVGAGCWGLRVAAGTALAARRRQRASRRQPIDAYSVAEPWRGFVREALTARSKFAETVERCQTGPMRDRLEEVFHRIDDGVGECWRVARLGAALGAALAGLDPERTSRELLAVQQRRREARHGGVGAAGAPPTSIEAMDQTEAALAAQLKAARRVQETVRRATDRLRVLTAQLNEAVAGAVELSLDAGDPNAAGLLAGDVDTVVGEIEALRQAMEEAEGTTMPGSADRS